MNTHEVLAKIDQAHESISLLTGEDRWPLLTEQVRGRQTLEENEDELTELAIISQLAALRDLLDDEVHARLVNTASDHKVSARRLSEAARISNGTASKWIAVDRAELP